MLITIVYGHYIQFVCAGNCMSDSHFLSFCHSRVELEKQSIDTNVNVTEREEGMARDIKKYDGPTNVTGKKYKRKIGIKEKHDIGYRKLI